MFACSFVAIVAMAAAGKIYIPVWTYFIALATGAIVVAPKGSGATGIAGCRVLVDAEGHAYGGYAIAAERVTVVIVRPDGVIGAVFKNAGGVEKYFSKLMNVVG